MVSRAFAWTGALLFGALVPALFVAGYSLRIAILPLAFAVTLAHAVILGLPVALLYRSRRWTRLSAAMVGGFPIGAFPGGLFAWPLNPFGRGSASMDGVLTIINGIPTLAGWLQYLELLGMLGSLGAAGSTAFWFALRWSGDPDMIAPNASLPTAGRSRRALAIAAPAIAGSIAVAAIPSIVEDRTCHNMFRDGRTSVFTKVNIDLDVVPKDWPRLATLFEQFGSSHRMSFRNSSETRPNVVDVLGLSACNEDGQVVTALEQRWASKNYSPLLPGGGVSIGIYDLSNGTDWQPLGRDLVALLDSEWRGKVRFRDGGGRFVGRPAALDAQQGDAPHQ